LTNISITVIIISLVKETQLVYCIQYLYIIYIAYYALLHKWFITFYAQVEAALKATAKAEEALKTEPNSVPESKPSPAKPPANIKGVPQSLLEKIRAKEAANAVATLTRDPKAEKQLTMLKRLPDVMRIIRSHFVTEKKPALPIDSVIQRLHDSFKSSIAQGKILNYFTLIVLAVAQWLEHSLRKQKVVGLIPNHVIPKML